MLLMPARYCDAATYKESLATFSPPTAAREESNQRPGARAPVLLQMAGGELPPQLSLSIPIDFGGDWPQYLLVDGGLAGGDAGEKQ